MPLAWIERPDGVKYRADAETAPGGQDTKVRESDSGRRPSARMAEFPALTNSQGKGSRRLVGRIPFFDSKMTVGSF